MGAPETRVSLILRLPNAADAEAWNEFVALYRPLVFSLARRGGLQQADAEELTQEVLLAGTPHFMAPEQAQGNAVGPHSDLWGVGAVLYFALTGRPPFDAEHPMAVLHQVCSVRPEPIERLRPEVPVGLARIVRRLMEKRPADRYHDCSSLKDDLDWLARGGGNRWPIHPVWQARRWLLPAITTMLALVLLGLFWAYDAGPAADRVQLPVSNRNTPDATTNAEWIAFQQAESRWRRQLDDLYEQTQPQTAINESLPRPEPAQDNGILKLLGQLDQFETDTTPPTVPRIDPQRTFSSEVRTALEQLDALTTDSPFIAP